MKRTNGTYCSRKCAAQRQQRALPDLTCSHCGETFYRKPSERKTGNNYCSRKCSNQAQSIHLHNNPELRRNKDREIICQNCGDIFHVKPHRVSKAKFCSKTCYYAHEYGTRRPDQKKDIPGEKNPIFKGTSNRVTARTNAIKYLGNKCMICGWDISIDVHHIVPIRSGGTNNIDNLIVLCPNHHRMADMKLISRDELTDTTRAAIAQLSDPLPQFGLQLSAQLENALQVPLFAESELPNPSD
jgi:5-methylcytosine-specific restriction endonuclease McrA